MREYVVENEFVKAVRKAGGVAYKLTSQTANGLPDRLVLFSGKDCVCGAKGSWEAAEAFAEEETIPANEAWISSIVYRQVQSD